MLDHAIGQKWKALQGERLNLERSISAELKAVSAKIEPRRSELEAAIDEIEAEHGDLQECEGCAQVDAMEAMGSSEDGWFCEECCAKWRAENPGDEDDAAPSIAEHDALVSQT